MSSQRAANVCNWGRLQNVSFRGLRIRKRTDRQREGFRAPIGVRKSPRTEPASLWVFRFSADPGMTRAAAKVAAEAVDRGYLQAFPAQVVGQIMAGPVNMVGCRRG